MRKCLLLLLLSTLQIFSEAFIEKFSTGGRNYQPLENAFIIKAGKEFTSFPALPNYLNDNELFMRVRYGYNSYRLYKGKLNPHNQHITPVFHFLLPQNMSQQNCSKLKFYSAINAPSDIPVVYFSKGGIHVEVASVLFYQDQNGEWQKIIAENVEDAKELQIKKGTLAITSKPAGIPIILDGKETGLLTPNYIQNVIVGRHRVTLDHKDYKTINREIVVTEDNYVSVACTLEVIKNKLTIEGTPIGAEVSINGVSVGTLPLVLPDLEKGDYTIEVSKELHLTEKYYYTISGESSDTLQVALKETFGRLVLPVVEGGEWYVNKQKVVAGEQELPAGRHQVSFSSRDLYEKFDTLIKISMGERVEPAFHFSRPEGELEILPLPMSAEVLIDGKSYGFGPQKVTLPIGEYAIEVRSKGYVAMQASKRVERGAYKLYKPMLLEDRQSLAQRVVERRSFRKIITNPKPKRKLPKKLHGTYVVFTIGGTSIDRSQSASITSQLRDNHIREGAIVITEQTMNRAFLNRGFFAVTVTQKDEAIRFGNILKADYAVFGRVIRDAHNSEPYLITQTVNLATNEVVSQSTKKWARETTPEELAFNGI